MKADYYCMPDGVEEITEQDTGGETPVDDDEDSPA